MCGGVAGARFHRSSDRIFTCVAESPTISLSYGGEPIADRRENVTLTTAAAGYAWVNTHQIWGGGECELGYGQDSH